MGDGRSWRWVTAVRQVDKLAAGLTADVSSLLLHLALHAGADGTSFASEDFLSRETGIPMRTLRRAVVRLRDLGLIVVQRRWRQSNLYRINEATVAALPRVERGRSNAARVAAQRGHGGLSNEAKRARQCGQGGPRELSENSQERTPIEEGAAPPPPPPPREEELAEDDAFALADACAEKRERPKPTRGVKSRDAIEQLIEQAKAEVLEKPWATPADALKLRLDQHYSRWDEALEKYKWALSLAVLQVPQPKAERPPAPMPPFEPRPPTPPGPRDEKWLVQMGLVEWDREYRNGGYERAQAEYEQVTMPAHQAELAAYREKLAAWRALVGQPAAPAGPVGAEAAAQAASFQETILALAKSKNTNSLPDLREDLMRGVDDFVE